MKGMLLKAFSLALFISVVPSFAMDYKAVEEVLTKQDPALIVRQSADDIVAATSFTNAAKNTAITTIVPAVANSYWEQIKAAARNAYSYVANSRVVGHTNSAAHAAAGYAHSALVAPFNYTVGALANKSGLADRVSNIGFVKNNSYYSTTIGKYAFGLAALYAGYKVAQATVNYFTTPATKKSEVKPAPVLQPISDSIAIEAKAKMAPVGESALLNNALEALLAKVSEGKTSLVESPEFLALSKLPYMQRAAAKSKTQSNATIVLDHLAGIDLARSQNNVDDCQARVANFTQMIQILQRNARIFYSQNK